MPSNYLEISWLEFWDDESKLWDEAMPQPSKWLKSFISAEAIEGLEL